MNYQALILVGWLWLVGCAWAGDVLIYDRTLRPTRSNTTDLGRIDLPFANIYGGRIFRYGVELLPGGGSGVAVAAGTNIVTVTNSGVVTVHGVPLFTIAAGTNIAFVTAGTVITIHGTTAPGGGDGFFVQDTSVGDIQYTNLIGSRMYNSVAGFNNLKLGTNTIYTQISEDVSHFAYGLTIDGQAYFIGKVNIGTSPGQFSLSFGTLESVSVTGSGAIVSPGTLRLGGTADWVAPPSGGVAFLVDGASLYTVHNVAGTLTTNLVNAP